MELEVENFYKDLDPILDEINDKFVKIVDEGKHKCVNVTYYVVSEVISRLKESDTVFGAIFSRLEYVGSYFDGLRVKEATEFDFNLIMKLPLDYSQILVENLHVPAGYVKVCIAHAKTQKYDMQPEIVKRTIEKWCDTNGYLQENRVREWMESVIGRTFGTGPILFPIKELTVMLKKNGPAFTLMIVTLDNQIDVDLVFTLEFSEKKTPPGSIKWIDKLAAPWVVVPKPLENNLFWRVSFSNSEKKLMHQQYKLKYINRMLKALRDAQTNMEIPSYFIKTLFLWEAHNCIYNNNPRFWEKRQGYLFLHMLNKLYYHLNKKVLPYYWHKNMNLFARLAPIHMKNMENQIKRIIYKIHELIKAKDKIALKQYILDLFSEQRKQTQLCTQGYTADSSNDSCSCV